MSISLEGNTPGGGPYPTCTGTVGKGESVAECGTEYFIDPGCDSGKCTTELLQYYLSCGGYTNLEKTNKDPLASAGAAVDEQFEAAFDELMKLVCTIKPSTYVNEFGGNCTTNAHCLTPGGDFDPTKCNLCYTDAGDPAMTTGIPCSPTGGTVEALKALYDSFTELRTQSGALTAAQISAGEPRAGMMEVVTCGGLNSRTNAFLHLLCVDIFDPIAVLAALFVAIGVTMFFTDCTRRIVRPGVKPDDHYNVASPEQPNAAYIEGDGDPGAPATRWREQSVRQDGYERYNDRDPPGYGSPPDYNDKNIDLYGDTNSGYGYSGYNDRRGSRSRYQQAAL